MTVARNGSQVPEEQVPAYLRDSIRSFDELSEIGKNLEPKKQIFGDYIHEDSLCHFPSERGSGKTLFGLQLCMAISRQFKTFCDEEIGIHGNTLFINAELGEDDLARRIALLQKNGPEQIHHYTPYKEHALSTRKCLSSIRDRVIGLIKNETPCLVVIDNWTIAFQDADSSDRKSVTQFMIDLLTLKDEYRFSILLVDHLKKGSSFKLTDSDLQSGSGAKTDLSDQDMFLRKCANSTTDRLLMRRKSRNAPEQSIGTAKLLYMDPETLWFNCKLDEVNESDYLDFKAVQEKEDREYLVMTLNQSGKSCREIARLTGIPNSTVHRIIQKGK